jgi:broad specificity phosphatase PhoE
MTTVLLLRHGHTAGNDAGPAAPLCGWLDLPLTPLGWQEAERLAGRLAEEPSFAALYASPLRRSRDTATLIGSRTGHLLRIDPDLREISCGALEGVPLATVEQQMPRLWEANLRQDDDNFRWPGGESYAEFRRRCTTCLLRLVTAHPGQQIAVVTHAGFIAQVVGQIKGASPARWSCYRPGNGSITAVAYRVQEGPALLRFDDRGHLEEGLARPQALQKASARRRTRAHA